MTMRIMDLCMFISSLGYHNHDGSASHALDLQGVYHGDGGEYSRGLPPLQGQWHTSGGFVTPLIRPVCDVLCVHLLLLLLLINVPMSDVGIIDVHVLQYRNILRYKATVLIFFLCGFGTALFRRLYSVWLVLCFFYYHFFSFNDLSYVGNYTTPPRNNGVVSALL